MEIIAAMGWATAMMCAYFWGKTMRYNKFLNTVIYGMVTGKIELQKVEVDSDSVSE